MALHSIYIWSMTITSVHFTTALLFRRKILLFMYKKGLNFFLVFFSLSPKKFPFRHQHGKENYDQVFDGKLRSLEFNVLKTNLCGFVCCFCVPYNNNFDVLIYAIISAIVETCITCRVSLVEQRLLTLPEHLSLSLVFSEICVTQSLVFFIVFCRSVLFLLTIELSVLNYYDFWLHVPLQYLLSFLIIYTWYIELIWFELHLWTDSPPELLLYLYSHTSAHSVPGENDCNRFTRGLPIDKYVDI